MKSKSHHQWQLELSPLQYHVCWQRGTEQAFSGPLWNHQETGRYSCICCGNPLFDSASKFHIYNGWPNFTEVITQGRVHLIDDLRHGMHRLEVACACCGAHLGHRFDDSLSPTHLRYCINSAALLFTAGGDIMDSTDSALRAASRA